VEAVFVRVAPVLNLHVGGRVIRTTAEHPFYVRGRGWIPAGMLEAGELLRSHDGGWLAVDVLTDSGEVTTVYNLRVAEYHTFFVGCEEWGFGVWAHNAPCLPTPRAAQHGAPDHHNAMNGQAALHQAGIGHPAMPPGVRPIPVETRTNQAPLNPLNPNGPPLRAGLPTTGGRYNVRPDVQVPGTDGRVYVTEITRRLPNGNIDVHYHNNRRLQLQAEYGRAWGGYNHLDIP
jgi:hypothetical protein